jgi:hypothetical protein
MNNAPFEIKDCAIIALATGKKAQNIRELKEILVTIDTDSIYYHFWATLLRPRFDNPQYNNDFAIWVAWQLNDKVLAERLALIDPTDFESLDQLRAEVIEVLEERAYELEYPAWSKGDEQFEFIRSQLVIFKTDTLVYKPADFCKILPKMSVGSIFYHFIDSRSRVKGGLDDFQNWLNGFNGKYQDLCHSIAEVDPYFISLVELREKLVEIFNHYFAGKKHEKNSG